MATIWNIIKKYASQLGITFNEPGITFDEPTITFDGKKKTVWTYQDKS